jgi:adhesin/invasin
VIGGALVSLLYVDHDQINAVLPYSLQANQEYQLIVTNGSRISTPQPVKIVRNNPTIFSASSTGTGQGLILHGNSPQLADANHPAKAGETLVMYCAGLGAVDSEISAGSAAPLDALVNAVATPPATIGGVVANITFAGLAPGFAAGLYQVNIIVPIGLTPGPSIPVVLSGVNGPSPTVTVAVQ